MKIIGIVGRVYQNKDNQEIIQLNDAIRKVLSNFKDIVPIVLLPTNPNSYMNTEMGKDHIEKEDKEKLDFLLKKCDGFIIPGGTSWYNFDEYILNYAISTNKPTLAICAGFQCLCSMFATNRNKFDMSQRLPNDKHCGNQEQYIHNVTIMNNTMLSKILQKDNIMVNSVHYYHIDFPMKDLIISAKSQDGIIEAVEHPNHPFLIGIQWHPEYIVDDNAKKIFNYYIDSIKKSQ